MNKNVLDCLWFVGSRKVAFAVVLFIAASAFLAFRLISGEQWVFCMGGCSALVGGGTVADRWINRNQQSAVVTTSSNDPIPPRR